MVPVYDETNRVFAKVADAASARIMAVKKSMLNESDHETKGT